MNEALRLAEPPSIENLKKIAASGSTTAIRNGLLASIKWIQNLEQSLKFEQAASFRDQVAELEAERDQLRAEVERLRVEREHWHKSFEYVSRILSGIHALMYPEPFTLSDGRTVVFRPKDPGPHEILQALSDRIRAIPDEVAAIDQARTTHKDEG